MYRGSISRIYNHFVAEIQKKIENFGMDRMEREVRELRLRREYWFKRCIGGYRHGFQQTLEFVPKDNGKTSWRPSGESGKVDLYSVKLYLKRSFSKDVESISLLEDWVGEHTYARHLLEERWTQRLLNMVSSFVPLRPRFECYSSVHEEINEEGELWDRIGNTVSLQLPEKQTETSLQLPERII